MSRKTDLEEHIRQSYALIREYEAIVQTSSRPEEKARARRVIHEQWGNIRRYLAEYRRLAGDALPTDIVEITAHFHEEDEQAERPAEPAHEEPLEYEYEDAARLLDEDEQQLNRRGLTRMGKVLRNPGFVVSVLALLVAIGTWFWPDIRHLLFSSATPIPTSSSRFAYQVQVRAKDTDEYVPGAEVMIAVGGIAPLDGITDANGLAVVSIPSSHAEREAKLTVEATGFRRHTQYVTLNVNALPRVVQLESE